MAVQYVGCAGKIAGYDVVIMGDAVSVYKDGVPIVTEHQVPNYGTSLLSLTERPGFRLGWACFDDDMEVLYFYDKDDNGFGYALNLSIQDYSEWGYAPF